MEEQTLDDIPECWISRGLSEKSREVAREKLNETNDRQSECLTQLRIQLERYAASHPDLTFSRRDDRFLTCFLRTARYDVDKAMSLLKKYIKFRSKNSHMLMGVSPETLKPALKNGVTMALPQRDPRGRRVLVFRMANSDKRKVSQLDMQRLSLYVLDALVQDEEAQVNGFVMVVDYGGMTMTHMSELDDSTVIEQNVAIFGEAHPACFEEYHIINQPWYYGLAKSAMKPYMSDDMKKRVSVCPNPFFAFARERK